MIVSRHAEVSLVALSGKMPIPASVIIDRLRNTESPTVDTALEVCRMTMSRGDRVTSSNGDSVVAIIRHGKVWTIMLRRSWNQPFNPKALRVEAVARWEWEVAAAA